ELPGDSIASTLEPWQEWLDVVPAAHDLAGRELALHELLGNDRALARATRRLWRIANVAPTVEALVDLSRALAPDLGPNRSVLLELANRLEHDDWMTARDESGRIFYALGETKRARFERTEPLLLAVLDNDGKGAATALGIGAVRDVPGVGEQALRI